MFKDGLLKGKRILVTGGGTGLGKEMAERFLELGAELFICGRRKSVCDATAVELTDEAWRAGDELRRRYPQCRPRSTRWSRTFSAPGR